ncbi:MAG TPA: DUF4159 domain-containing protein [Gemmataceae bacterium]|nr:DUF4159 domain-containing protein [Gemmataceae bacterium]
MEPWFSAKNLFFPQTRREFLRTSAIGLSGLTLGIPTPVQAADDNPRPLVDRVRRAIERGVQFLRDQENHNGNWELDGGLAASRYGGETSLVMLALLNAGVKPDDPIIERGLKFLRTVDPRDTYVVGLQTMVFAAAGKPIDFPLIQRNVQWLIDARVMDGKELLGWTYMKGGDPKLNIAGISDNSNTQYALLGLHEGHRAGAEVSKEVWKSIETYYKDNQFDEGGWGYLRKLNPVQQMPPILTMTVAGLCGLLIAGMELNEGRETDNHDGTFKNCGVYHENKEIGLALQWIGKNFRLDRKEAVFYNIYGIERAGRLTGLRFLGNHDWYGEGCVFLVGAQREDGSWHARTGHDNWPVVSTSFALLFLAKGRTPIMISKLVHGRGDWNNDRNDARNLVEFVSKEMFKKQPLAWQIFEAKRGLAKGTREELLALTGELLMSPVAYFNGHDAPQFTRMEEELLKEYVEQGGFLFAEACCGKAAFRKGFEDLMTKLFPDHQLKDLPAGHQIWSAPFPIKPGSFGLQGIEMGCKTVVVFSPRDMSCHWESNRLKDERTLEAFRLGGNIIAYASGMELPKPRLTPADVVRKDDDRKVPRGFLKVAQLKYGDDWKPAPNAMKNLTAYLADRPRLDVGVEKDPVTPGSPRVLEYKFLYMHGRRGFEISDAGLDNLRAALQTGGLLFADACCGKKEFDAGFREFVKKLFPNEKLERIPPEDELFSQDINDNALTSVRCRRERGAAFREVAPELEGIKFKSRWVVIYSRYDVGCALEKHQSTDCLGHDYDSALKIGAAAVLYALKR